MAKQLVNPIERHVEKAVLGITGLLLLGVVATYLFSTPNKMEFGQEVVTPANIDSKVAQKADDVLASVRNREPEKPIPVPKPDFKTTIALAELPAATPFLPMVPVVDPHQSRIGAAGLAQVVQLPSPELKYGRSTIELPPDWPRYAELQGKDVTDWVTSAAIFDVSEMSKRLANEYGGTRRKVIYAGLDIQRRAQKEDGSWSDTDWAAIEPWPAFSVSPPPPVPLFEDEGKVLIKSTDHQEILKFAEELETPATRQMEILRPLMRKQFNGDQWSFPMIKPLKDRDVLLMDDEFLNPNQAQPSVKPVSRYTHLASDSKTETITNAKKLAALEDQLKGARAICSLEQAKLIHTDATAIESDSEATGADKTNARKIVTAAKRLIDDINANVCVPTQKAGGLKNVREPMSQQLLWAIDGKPGSLTPGESYQYRMRVVVYNPRTGEPDQFAKPHDAEVVLLRGDWSPPSEIVTIPPMTAYFATSSSKERDSVSMEIFTWFGGYWVKPKSSSRIEKKVGEWVKTEARVIVPGIDGKVAEPNVNFDAQRMIADIDFDRPFRERQKMGKTGVKFGKVTPTAAILLVNDKGELEERYESLDKASPELTKYREMVYKPDKEKP